MTVKAEQPAAKKATKKTAPKSETAAVEDSQKVGFRLEPSGETKQYAKFSPPADSGCVGSIYAPKGTKVIKVLLEG